MALVTLTLTDRPLVQAGNVTEVRTYTSSISSDADGPLDLKLEANYNSSITSAPIMLVMHGYSGASGKMNEVRAHAQVWRDRGFFAVSVVMRGRDGSDGVRDSGGLEIYDIYDAAEYVKAQFGGKVDPTNISITGYSGGGGNVMSALTKFPDYFRSGSSYFGMSDYGRDPVNGWYNNGANVGGTRTPQLDIDVGNPNTGGAAVRDRYLARASNLAAKNNPYSEIHLFANADEAICPPVNHASYRTNALAAAGHASEFSNITVHTGAAGTYADFNRNGQNEATEQQYWPHTTFTTTHQQAGDTWFADRLLDGSIAQPVLHGSGELFVAGFIKTSKFGLFLGDGQNAAGNLSYTISSIEKTFTLRLISELPATGVLTVDTADMSGRPIRVLRNGTEVELLTAGSAYRYAGLASGDRLTTAVVPEPAAVSVLGVLPLAALRRRGSAGR